MEKRLHEIKGVYVFKNPNYFEKISLGMYMEECSYKVFDDKTFAPEAVKYLNEFKLANFESDHLMDIREVSHVC